MALLFLILLVLASVAIGFFILVQNPKGGGLAGNIARGEGAEAGGSGSDPDRRGVPPGGRSGQPRLAGLGQGAVRRAAGHARARVSDPP